MSRSAFESLLRQGKKNALGRTLEVVAAVLADRRKLRALYSCYQSEDEWARLRVSNAFKRVFRENPAWFDAWADKFIDDVARIDQPSAQWTVAQLVHENAERLDAAQTRRAKTRMKRLLETSDDWIVINSAMQALGHWAADDARLREWLVPRLQRMKTDSRRSIAGRARKLIAALR